MHYVELSFISSLDGVANSHESPKMEAELSHFPQALVVALSVLTIASDLYAHRVRNAWLLVALLLGAAWMVWMWLAGEAGAPWAALVGLMVGLLALLPFHLLGWMGAGDVKFFAVLGFLMGGKALLPIWIVASLLGGVHALLLILSRRAGVSVQWMQERLASTGSWRDVLAARQGRRGLPYAAYMAMGALLVVARPQLAHW